MTMYRIYRRDKETAFGEPLGWLAARTPAWYPSSAESKIGQFDLSKASELVAYWNKRFRADKKGYVAVMEEVEQ